MKTFLITTSFFASLVTAGVARAQDAAVPAQEDTASQGAYFEIDGDKIFYRVQGTGTPMLLIHGFPLSDELFKYQASYFSQSYEVITPDLPGFGRSTTSTAKQTEARYAREMLGLLAHLNIGKAIIGGHSMGGQVTLEMYRQQPKVFAGMILFDTNPAPASIVEMAEWPAYGRQAEKLGSASIAPPVVGVMITGKALAQKPVLGTIVTDMVSEAMPEGVAGGGHALATRPDYQPLLAKIDVPTLVVVGQDDPVYPVPVSQALANAITGSTLAIIPGAAHASMLQSPQVVDTAVAAFVANVP